MDTKQVAELHGVTRGCVVQWIRKGWLDAEKRGRAYYIDETTAIKFNRRPKTGRPVK